MADPYEVVEIITGQLASKRACWGVVDPRQQACGHAVATGSALGDGGGATAELAALATGIAGSIQFQDITRQATEQVQAALERLGDQTELLIAYVDGRVQPEEVQEHRHAVGVMADEYVIQRQRATHAGVASGAVPSRSTTGPAIELF